MLKKIDRFHFEQFACLPGNLKATREGEHSLLDNTLIAYGSGISTGDRHEMAVASVKKDAVRCFEHSDRVSGSYFAVPGLVASLTAPPPFI